MHGHQFSPSDHILAGAISREHAIEATGREFGYAGEGMGVEARYGIMNNEQMYSCDGPTETRTYVALNRPVWVITFTGLQIGSRGPGPTMYHHELNVVVDAFTGERLYSYSYR